MKKISWSLLLLPIAFVAFAQTTGIVPLSCEINKVYPPISIDKADLEQATTLADLNRLYKSNWVRTFIAVEISASQQGALKKVVGKSDVLNQAQKDLMIGADNGTAIRVRMEYIPENNLKDNPPKEFDFTFTVQPEKEATFIGGEQALNQYLEAKVMAKIPVGSFTGYDLAAVKFTIDEEGQVTDVQLVDDIYYAFKNEAIHALLLEVVREMPCWQAAAYADGQLAEQELVLTVGHPESCITNLLNIRREER